MRILLNKVKLLEWETLMEMKLDDANALYVNWKIITLNMRFLFSDFILGKRLKLSYVT